MKPLSETYKELGIGFTFPIEIWDANDRVTYFEDCDDYCDDYWERYERDAEGRPTYYEDRIATGRSGSVMQMEAWITMKTAQV